MAGNTASLAEKFTQRFLKITSFWWHVLWAAENIVNVTGDLTRFAAVIVGTIEDIVQTMGVAEGTLSLRNLWWPGKDILCVRSHCKSC